MAIGPKIALLQKKFNIGGYKLAVTKADHQIANSSSMTYFNKPTIKAIIQ